MSQATRANNGRQKARLLGSFHQCVAMEDWMGEVDEKKTFKLLHLMHNWDVLQTHLSPAISKATICFAYTHIWVARQ